jgi:hypothetical protein
MPPKRRLLAYATAGLCVLMFGYISDRAVELAGANIHDAGFTQLAVMEDVQVVPFAPQGLAVSVDITNNRSDDLSYTWTATYYPDIYMPSGAEVVGTGTIFVAAGKSAGVRIPATDKAGWVRFTVEGLPHTLQWRVGK